MDRTGLSDRTIGPWVQKTAMNGDDDSRITAIGLHRTATCVAGDCDRRAAKPHKIVKRLDNSLRMPEVNVALFSFLLNFVWEFLQAPAYAGMAEMRHWEGIRLCAAATAGDVAFALAAFWIASLLAGTRSWPIAPSFAQFAVFLTVGVGLTVAFEFYYTKISLRWTYSELMPLVPPFGTGLAPLLQWLIVPPLVIWLARRQMQPQANDGANR